MFGYIENNKQLFSTPFTSIIENNEENSVLY